MNLSETIKELKDSNIILKYEIARIHYLFLPAGINRKLPPGTSKFIGDVVGSSFKNVRDEIGKRNFAEAFRENFRSQSGFRTALDAIRIANAGASTISGILDNGSNFPSNGELKSLPFMSNSNIQSLGKNEAIYLSIIKHLFKWGNLQVVIFGI